jgi:hypothetical protein
MTTKLTRPVARASAVTIRDGDKPRTLIVTLHAEYLTLRLSGRRQEEVLSLERMRDDLTSYATILEAQ